MGKSGKGKLLPQNKSALPEVEDVIKSALKQVNDEAARMIEDGLSIPTASTGTPIDELHGLPKVIAQTSNIGGGSIATGGGGFKAGDKIKQIYESSKVAMQTLDLAQQQKESQTQTDSMQKLEESSTSESE